MGSMLIKAGTPFGLIQFALSIAQAHMTVVVMNITEGDKSKLLNRDSTLLRFF